jgi:hypothetical protein
MQRLFCLFLLAAFCCNASNMLRNGNFSKLSTAGLPVAWEARDLQATVSDGVVSLEGKGFFVHNAFALVPEETYVLTYDVRSDSACPYRAYCEWHSTGTHSTWASPLELRHAGSEWKTVFVTFTYDNNPAEPYRSIMAFQLPEGGKLQIRKVAVLSMRDGKGGNLLRNGDFSIKDDGGTPLGWKIDGVQAKSLGEGAVSLKGQGFLVNYGLPLEANRKYMIRWSVRSAKQSEYRIYCEWWLKNSQVSQASDAALRKGGVDWESFEEAFTYKPDCDKAYLVIAAINDADLEFRNLSVALLDENRGSGIKALGGEWFVVPPSKVVEDGVLLVKTDGTLESSALLKGVKVRHGQYYSLSFRTKCNDEGMNNGEPYRVQVLFSGSKTSVMSPWDDTWNLGFQKKSFAFTVPEECDGTAQICLYSGQRKAIYFRDFVLEEQELPVAERHQVTLTKPAYRNTIYAGAPVDEIQGSVATGKEISRVEVTLSKGTDKDSLYSKVFENSGEQLEFAIPAGDLANGNYILTVRCNQKQPVTLRIRKLAKAAVEVIQGEDLLFRVNGKPFFPVMFWGNCFDGLPIEETFYTLGRNGVNLMIVSSGDELALLDTLNLAQRNSLKVILNAGIPKNLSAGAVQTWEHRLTNLLSDEVLAHPALLGYFLEDEPMWCGVELGRLLKAREVLENLDPYRPTWINEAPRGTIEGHRQYSAASDIYGLDIYPVGSSGHSGLEDKTLSAVGKYVRFLDEAVNNRKPIWMVLQGFAWQALNREDDGTGYPDRRQNRYVVFDTIVEGGEGIVWWGLSFVKRAFFYDVLFDVTRELHVLSGLLTEGKTLARQVSDNAEVRTRLFEYGGKRYLLAVNGTAKKVSVCLDAGFTAKEVAVLRENRCCRVTGGSVADTFEPYAVHWYAEAELPAPAWELPAENEKFTESPMRLLKAMETAIPYTGQANWIWEAGKEQVAFSETTLQKEFTLRDKVRKATVMAAVDDCGEVFLNGKSIGKTINFMSAVTFDCTVQLLPGANVLSVYGKDTGQLPCGVLAELRLEYEDGSSQTLMSDETWSTRGGTPVKVIAPFGSGAWGKQTKVIPLP